MAHINRRYIDSHWLIFALRGVLAVIFGWVALFHSNNSLSSIIALMGVFLLSLSVIEFFNALHRACKKTGWIVSVAVALVDVAAALLLLLTLDQSVTWHLIVVAIYTFTRGIFEILIGFRTTIDPTDRFIWVLTGICGAVMGIVIFNANVLASTTFIRFFGAYLLVLGISSLIYGIHNRSQKIEDHVARLEAAKSRKKSSKSSKKK
ncbi:DUF308 domain-containing protein [Candidatus Saccharibacteria bacterium]|nr:DUF308 domain-containing protein [Candidatus Saccharibacteria bacterium]